VDKNVNRRRPTLLEVIHSSGQRRPHLSNFAAYESIALTAHREHSRSALTAMIKSARAERARNHSRPRMTAQTIRRSFHQGVRLR